MYTDLRVWLDHFEYHATRRCALPPGKPGELTLAEHRLIAGSIATFQLGEQSDGHSLLRAAQRYERDLACAPLARIVALLIAEEQHHAELLGAFMDEHRLPRKNRDWTDRIFRRLRRLAGFELYLTVLVTAELIGKVYYRALEAATGSRQLQTLCRVLVADELAHVGLESDLLRGIHAQKHALSRAARVAAHRAFFAGASLAVWLCHRGVLRRAGYRISTFLRACAAQYSFYLEPPRIRESSNPVAGMTALEDSSARR